MYETVVICKTGKTGAQDNAAKKSVAPSNTKKETRPTPADKQKLLIITSLGTPSPTWQVIAFRSDLRHALAEESRCPPWGPTGPPFQRIVNTEYQVPKYIIIENRFFATADAFRPGTNDAKIV